jgi:hypothetical protein
MSRETVMKDKKLTNPQAEHLFLKRNALLLVILGGFYLFQAGYEWLSTFDNVAFRFGFAFVSLIIVLDLIWILSRVFRLASKVKSAFWFGNFKDEYFNHLNHKAYKYACNIAGITAFLLMMISDSAFSTPWLLENTALITLSTLFVGYGVPVLFWLRGHDE